MELFTLRISSIKNLESSIYFIFVFIYYCYYLTFLFDFNTNNQIKNVAGPMVLQDVVTNFYLLNLISGQQTQIDQLALQLVCGSWDS